ncbi:MAG: hypothetical protein H6907_04835 [Hyphomicrobiales bacterium]|nr:hypothetical protein [Hyphomicrobiales bacterium]MCP5371040.1 hypothetical protein [Hyphomicrobiales bacterium]
MRMLPTLATLATLATLVLLAACAGPAKWHKAGADDRQSAADLAACRSLAARQAERDLAPEASRLEGTDLRRESSLGAQMLQYEYKKRRARLFTACMAQRGYAKQP